MRWLALPLALLLPSCVLVLPGLDTDGFTQNGDTTGGNGMTPTERCDDYCAALVAPDCDSGPTLDGCLLTCRSLTSAPVCDPKAHTYFDCAASGDITCDGNGDPVAAGCGLAYLDAIACATTENPNPEIVTPCADYCDNIDAAMCTNNGTTEECNNNCLWLGNTGTGCNDEWGTFLECANTNSWSCILGFAVSEGCGTPWNEYWTCINAG